MPTFAHAEQSVADLVQRFQLHTAERERDKELLQRHPPSPKLRRTGIDATDRQIDQLVYELYGLMDKEIRIVEEGTK